MNFDYRSKREMFLYLGEFLEMEMNLYFLKDSHPKMGNKAPSKQPSFKTKTELKYNDKLKKTKDQFKLTDQGKIIVPTDRFFLQTN